MLFIGETISTGPVVKAIAVRTKCLLRTFREVTKNADRIHLLCAGEIHRG